MENDKTRLYKLNEVIADYCTERLKANNIRSLNFARIVLKLSDETITKFKIGFFPRSIYYPKIDTFVKYIEQEGFNENDLVATGFMVESDNEEDSGYRYPHSSRIIFPIFDTKQNIVSFVSKRMFRNENHKIVWLRQKDTIIYRNKNPLYIESLNVEINL